MEKLLLFGKRKMELVVKSLKDEGKEVALSRIAGGFSLTVTNNYTGATYSRNNLHLKDFDDNLFNKMRNV